MNILELKNITKKYNKNIVLNNISLSIKKGEIHTILGENGAGKSTLMNILSGMPIIQKTGGFSGNILLNNKKINIKNPNDALKYGIYIVKQELSIIDEISVWENIFINNEITKETKISKVIGSNFEIIDKKNMIIESNKLLKKISTKIKSEQNCNNLTINEKYFIEILREIKNINANIIIFDEPTSAFSKEESTTFYKIIKNLSNNGISIILITHKIDEILKYSDTITILKNGKILKTLKNENITENTLIDNIIEKNENITKIEYSKDIKKFNEIIMSLKNINCQKENNFIKNFSINIYKGEILGIYGNEKNIITDILGGINNYTGNIIINKNNIDNKNIIKKTVSYVSYDRKETNLYLSGSIYENICTNAMYINKNFLKKFLFIKIIDKKTMINTSKYWINELNIKCSSPEQKVKELSGGNQQKVCISKALTLNLPILVISEPTRGIDINSKNIIIKKLKETSYQNNTTIIIASSDLNELKDICNRIIILKNGEIEKII